MKHLKILLSILIFSISYHAYAIYTYKELEALIIAKGNPHNTETLGTFIEDEETNTPSPIQGFSQTTVYNQIHDHQILDAGSIMRELKTLSTNPIAQFELIGYWLDLLFCTSLNYYNTANQQCTFDSKGNLQQTYSKNIYLYVEKQLSIIFEAITTFFGDINENTLFKFTQKFITYFNEFSTTPIHTQYVNLYTEEKNKRNLSIQLFTWIRTLTQLKNYTQQLYTGEQKLADNFNIVGLFIEPIIYNLFNRHVIPILGYDNPEFQSMQNALWNHLLTLVNEKSESNFFEAIQGAALFIYNPEDPNAELCSIQILQSYLSSLLNPKYKNTTNTEFTQTFLNYLHTFNQNDLAKIILTERSAIYLNPNDEFWNISSETISSFLTLIQKLDIDIQHNLITRFSLLGTYNTGHQYFPNDGITIDLCNRLNVFFAIRQYLIAMDYKGQMTFNMLEKAYNLRNRLTALSITDHEAILNNLNTIIDTLETETGQAAIKWFSEHTNQGEVIQDRVIPLNNPLEPSDWANIQNLRHALIDLFTTH